MGGLGRRANPDPPIVDSVSDWIPDCGTATAFPALHGGWFAPSHPEVVLPVARNGIFATAVFTFIFAWNDHIFAPVLARTDVMTFTVQVTGYLGAHSTLWAKISAMSPLGTLRISLVVATMQR